MKAILGTILGLLTTPLVFFLGALFLEGEGVAYVVSIMVVITLLIIAIRIPGRLLRTTGADRLPGFWFFAGRTVISVFFAIFTPQVFLGDNIDPTGMGYGLAYFALAGIIFIILYSMLAVIPYILHRRKFKQSE